MTDRDGDLGLKTNVVVLVEEGKRPYSLHTEVSIDEGHAHHVVCVTFLKGPAELAVFHDPDRAARAEHFLKTGQRVE